MSYSECDFSIKFFRPSQRTVISHNGFLDTRTKRTIARDRLIVAEQRNLEIERQKSASNLQLLTFEQKQLEKKILSLQNLTRSPRTHPRSVSENNIYTINRAVSVNESLNLDRSKATASINNENENILFLSTTNNLSRTVSTCSDGILSENSLLRSDTESSEEDKDDLKLVIKKTMQLPLIAIIPPDDDVL